LLRFGLAVVGAAALSGCIVGSTGEARYVGDESAALQGSVWSDRTDFAAEYWFEYGTTAGYGSATDRLVTGVQEGQWVPIEIVVYDLQPATTYHYRLCGEGSADGHGVCGADRTFTTGVGRESLRGSGGVDLPLKRGVDATVAVVGEPAIGFLEGQIQRTGYFEWPPFRNPPLFLHFRGEGTVECFSVEGNVAAAVFDYGEDFTGAFRLAIVVEDNGETGDRFTMFSAPSVGCVEPDASLIPSPAPGEVVTADFTVDDD
jgi:hypothetical protein